MSHLMKSAGKRLRMKDEVGSRKEEVGRMKDEG
jgi:HAMP domain-containing protein